MEKKQYLTLLFLLLLIKAFVMVGLILYAGLGLGPDEAQYWTWSQALDWGYYSKPPAIAWQIWLGTKLFGNTELGVRFLSVILAFLTSLSVFFLSLACNTKPRTAFWAAVVMAFSPLGILNSFLAITDVGMVFFWTLACLIVAKDIQQKTAPRYYLLGFIIMCGALFKWSIYIYWGIVICFLPLFPNLRRSKIFSGIAISLIGLFPSIIWNYSHDWVTFRHVLSTVAGGHAKTNSGSLLHGNFFEFIGAQMALISPILFIILLFAFTYLVRKRESIPNGLFFSGGCSLIILVIASLMAVFQKIQGNWVDFAYPSAIVLLAWYACECTKLGLGWLKAGVALSIILIALLFSQTRFPLMPYKMNPFKHNLGWNQLPKVLNEAGYDPNKEFLFGDKYQMSSILSFYGPLQKRAYFLNLLGTRKNQFSFWPGLSEERRGETGFFVVAENVSNREDELSTQILDYKDTLQTYFKQVEFLGMKPLYVNENKILKAAWIFKCIDYNGKQPIDPELY